MRAEHLAVSGNHVFWRYVSEYGRATRLLRENLPEWVGTLLEVAE